MMNEFKTQFYTQNGSANRGRDLPRCVFGLSSAAGRLLGALLPQRTLVKRVAGKFLFSTLQMPISTLITGAENKTLLEEKIGLARSFSVMSEAEREKLLEQVLLVPNRTAVEYYKKVG